MSFLLWRSFQFKSHPHVMTTYVCRQRAVEEETKLCHLEGPLPFLLHIRSLSACLPPSPPLYEPIHQHYCEVIAFQINECVPGAEDEDARPDDEEQGGSMLTSTCEFKYLLSSWFRETDSFIFACLCFAAVTQSFIHFAWLCRHGLWCYWIKGGFKDILLAALLLMNNWARAMTG